MGILRTDQVSGLGGANAIKGSVKFTSGGALDIDLDGATIGTSNFTIEAWVFWFGNYYHQITGSDSNNFNLYINNDDGDLVFYNGVSSFDLSASNVKPNEWTHIALVREGTSSSQTKVYINGTNTQSITVGTNFSFSRLATGTNYFGGSVNYGNGYQSNLRFTLDAVYTSAFTPPNNELTVLDNTIVLCCQSPGNILQDATGKTITPFKHTLNSADAVASHFTPNSPVGFSTTTDVGTQFGSTFDGVTTFDSQAYFVPPGGNTRERNRGRGVYTSGHNPSPGAATNGIEFMEIQSQGNAQDFGDLTSARRFPGASSSSTRGVFGSGLSTNVMDFITIATTANATDFGDMTRHGFSSSGTSDGIRGVYAGGYQQPESGFVNSIDFITFATAGNAQDFGDTSVPACHMAGGSSRTRGVYMGMSTPSPSPRNVIEFVTIQSQGVNASDFGDCSVPRGEAAGASNSTRMIAAGGDAPAGNVEVNLIEFVTMASAGDATDFGDLTVTRSRLAGISNSTRGVFLKGHVLPAGTVYNTAEFVNIASTGNAIDFGDTFTGGYECSGCSDSHGGIE